MHDALNEQRLAGNSLSRIEKRSQLDGHPFVRIERAEAADLVVESSERDPARSRFREEERNAAEQFPDIG